jgi:hypothetical protein
MEILILVSWPKAQEKVKREALPIHAIMVKPLECSIG